jgi:hypothetical protein
MRALGLKEMTSNRHDYRTMFARAAADAHSEFASDAANSVGPLTSWISWLRTSRPESVESALQFFDTIRGDSEGNPLNWCNSRGIVLTPKFAALLTEVGTTLAPLAAYVLGRAAVATALSEPVGTAGLTLPYRLVERLDELGIGFAGANDALRESNIRENVVALEEIDREIALMAKDPTITVRSFDRERVRGAARTWQEAVGVEQALSSHINELFVEIFPFAQVMLSIAHTAPDLIAFRLEALSHPALIRFVLDLADHAKDQATILKLLEHAPIIFDANGTWMRASAARLVLDAFESSCLESVGVTLQSGADDKEAAEEAAAAELQGRVAPVAEILSNRADGPRLAVEWLAHLVNQCVGRERGEPLPGKRTDRFRRLFLILNAAFDRFASDSWSQPTDVWSLFGADPTAYPTLKQPEPPTQIASWSDGIGQRDAVTPLAVASLLVRAGSDPESRISQVLPWLMSVINRLELEPQLLWLSSYPSSILFDILAWPVSCCDDPAAWVAAAWRNASEARLRARFNRVDDSTVVRRFHGEPEPVAQHMNRCSAIIELGSSILRWTSLRKNRDAIAPPLAYLLQDMIDEYRYCFPPILLGRAARLVGRLSIDMAVAGLLGQAESIKGFVSRYDGDDDALVAAAANAAASGIPPGTIASGMKAAGVDICSLRDRWISWMKKRSHERVAFAPAVEQLERICESAERANP